MTTIVPRTVWGVPVTGDPVRVPASKRTGFVVHWDGGANPTDADGELRLLWAYHRHHLITLRAGGFGYNLAVGPATGKIYEGRGLNTRGAHAGGANTPNIGVVLIGGPRNLTHAAKQGLREAYAIACTHTGRTLKQLAHRDVNTTACPGDDITRWIHGGGLTGGTAPAAPPGREDRYRPGDITVAGVTIRQVQERLVAHGYTIGPYGIDNQMGTHTLTALGRFQEDQNVEQDLIVGPVTWDRLQATPASAPNTPTNNNHKNTPASGGRKPSTPRQHWKDTTMRIINTTDKKTWLVGPGATVHVRNPQERNLLVRVLGSDPATPDTFTPEEQGIIDRYVAQLTDRPTMNPVTIIHTTEGKGKAYLVGPGGGAIHILNPTHLRLLERYLKSGTGNVNTFTPREKDTIHRYLTKLR